MKNYIKDNTKGRILNLVIILSIAISVVTFAIFILTGTEIPGLSSIALAFGLFALSANSKEEEKQDSSIKPRKKDRMIYITVGVLGIIIGISRILLAVI